jgi:hypothetical protein
MFKDQPFVQWTPVPLKGKEDDYFYQSCSKSCPYTLQSVEELFYDIEQTTVIRSLGMDFKLW